MPRRTSLFVPWLLLATVCSVLMWLLPGEETVPYHVAWIGVGVAFGFEPWPLGRTLAAIMAYTVVTGGILVFRASVGDLAWEETTEIPLMAVLVFLSVWHVRRRQTALRQVELMAARSRLRSQQREWFSRLTSHEMRTPVTIATGFVALLLERVSEPQSREDLGVVQDELHRLNRASDRLLRMITLQDQTPWEDVDLDHLLDQVATRWGAVAERTWQVDVEAGACRVPPEYLRVCLDTLIENALRYTAPGDVVRLCSRPSDGWTLVGVADSGSGLSPVVVDAVNRHQRQGGVEVPSWGRDSASQTGLGLGLVAEMATLCRGRVVAGRSAEGGALVMVAIPHEVQGADTSAVYGPARSVRVRPLPV